MKAVKIPCHYQNKNTTQTAKEDCEKSLSSNKSTISQDVDILPFSFVSMAQGHPDTAVKWEGSTQYCHLLRWEQMTSYQDQLDTKAYG